MISYGQDETIEIYAIKTFNGIIKSNVQRFSTKWSDIWPLLQENPECVKLIEVIGIEKAHKVFCQCLTDIKADVALEAEPHPHLKTRALDQQQMRNIQSELDEAVQRHPDSG